MSKLLIPFFFIFQLSYSILCFTEMEQLKVETCLAIHKLKMHFDKEVYDEYILTNSNKHNTTKEKTILLAIQACFLRISDEDATYIIEKFRKRQEINVNSHKIESLIYQEDVGNSTEEKGEFQKSFDYFLDIFDEVIKKLERLSRARSEDEVQFYKQPMFRFFVSFVICNTFVVFCLRIRRQGVWGKKNRGANNVVMCEDKMGYVEGESDRKDERVDDVKKENKRLNKKKRKNN